MSYTIKEIRKRVYLIESDTQYEIASMFLRPQEYYESPYENIRGKYFTLEEYMDTYVKATGAFTYYTDWCGFNIPSATFKKFLTTFAYDLKWKENLLVDLIKQINPTLEGDFYIIGACKESSNKEALAHETAHAFWALDSEYRDKMFYIVQGLSKNMYEDAYYALISRGYDFHVVDDEIHAYLATAPRSKLLETLGWRKNPNVRIPQNAKKFYKEYDATHK